MSKSRQTTKWAQKFALLQEFYAEYGRTPTSREIYEGETIGSWFHTQRQQARKGVLPADRKEELLRVIPNDAFGEQTPWNVILWTQKLSLLQGFYAEYGRLPKQHESYKGETIGSWLSTQRQLAKKGVLSEDRRAKLAELGLALEVTCRERRRASNTTTTWEESFLLLQEFQSEYGRLPAYKEVYKGENIGIWLSNQRQQEKRGRLPEERREKLLALGPVLDARAIAWEEKFSRLKEFCEEHGRCPKQDETYKWERIGEWLVRQKQHARKGLLSAYQMDKLRELAPYIDTSDATAQRNMRWENHYNLLQEFYTKHGRFPTQTEEYLGANIGKWLGNQKYQAKKGLLSADKRDKLLAISAIAPTSGGESTIADLQESTTRLLNNRAWER